MSESLSLEAAIALLRETVVDLRDRGRSTLAAGIKPELQRRSPGFDQAAWGFERFSDFLNYAAESGVVEVVRRGRQPVVTLPGEDPIDARQASPRPRQRRPRVRPDLWKAFTNWGEWIRLWDQEKIEAVRIPVEATNDTPEFKTRRELWRAQPDRFVEIPGIPQEVQLGWMEEFASKEPGRLGLLLRYALKEEERKAQAFSQAIREEPASYARWMDLRVTRVVAAIESWRAEHDLPIEVLERDPDSKPPAAPSLSATTEIPSGDAQLSETEIRALVHKAVDAMSVDELLRIPIQLGHVVRRPR